MPRLAILLLLAHAGLASSLLAQPRPKVPPRRAPVTAELARTAFADTLARTLLERARAARTAQDSAITAYDAKSWFRMSAGLGVRRLGPERLLFRVEHVARVRWARGGGVLVEPTGRRAAVPMGGASLEMSAVTPIPYFPGRDALWIPSGDMRVVKAEVDENEMLHPLAGGAEAYYRYATGDSLSFRLPDGRIVLLRELRITARRQEFRGFVGSFWFDVAQGHLVRAAYRTAGELDIWQSVSEEQRREIEALERQAREDTGAAGRAARREAERESKELGLGERLGRMVMSPARATLSAITVEYGLHQGRFWLPKRNVAEGEMQMGFLRVPVRFEEAYTYDRVNGTDPIPFVAVAESDTIYPSTGGVNIGGPIARRDTSLAARTLRTDSLIDRYARRVDSLRGEAERYRAKGDTSKAEEALRLATWYVSLGERLARRRAACTADGDSTYYAGTRVRYGGAVRMQVRMPCNEARLDESPDMPGSIYEPNEELFGTAERDALLGALGIGLQPAWGPQRPRVRTGLDLLRYNRVEGLSPGVALTSELGLGYRARLEARIGTADRVPNGELSLARGSGTGELRLATFHRLAVANDDWGSPLSFGASLSNLLYARDEGFYYRAWGLELAGVRDAPGPLGGATMQWRLFGEQHRSAGAEPRTQLSFGNLVADARFERNIDAARLTAIGAGADVARSFGANPRATRLHLRARTEAAFTGGGDSATGPGYGRLVLDATAARPLGRVAVSVTGAAGTSLGDPPVQRAFFVGGLQTVRGQFARATGDGRVGDAFWLARTELGIGLALRPTVFYDIGWAGPRGRLTSPGRPLSGAGVGVSLLDGLARFDVSRGIAPEQRWRVDASLGARF